MFLSTMQHLQVKDKDLYFCIFLKKETTVTTACSFGSLKTQNPCPISVTTRNGSPSHTPLNKKREQPITIHFLRIQMISKITIQH